jgi:RHS repeat-associated protein
MMRQNPSALRSFALYLGSNLVAERDIGSSNTIRYQHTDVLGSVIAESNTAGTITSSSVYQPFGERIGGQKTGLGFTGHLEDTDIGLTYMQQRYYDPVIGRFYSNDPVGFTASNPMMFNRYAYGNNNPYKYTDPTGETAEAVVLSRERGKVFVYPPSSHAHASKRHAQGYQGLGKGSPQQFMSKFGMQDYKMSATVVGEVVESGAEYYQEGTGTTVYTFETGQQIGELGETALSVATTPLSSLKDPAKIAEVTTMMTEAGVSQDQYRNVEVVTTIAPDNGTFKRDDAILMKKQE